MTSKVMALLALVASGTIAHSEDIAVTWTAGATPSTLADGKVTLTYDGGGNVATIVATPAKDERIVIGGDALALAENATITMGDVEGGCGALVFTNNVTGSGTVTFKPETDDSVITWEADSKSTALDVSPNWKLLFPGKRLSEYEPVESNQDPDDGGKKLDSGPSNPNRMVARCITRGTDADGRDTMEFELQCGTSTYLKSVKIQLRQGEGGIEGVAVSAAYVPDLLTSSVGDDIDYIAAHKAQYPSYKNVKVWGPSQTTTGLAYGTYVLTMRRTSGLPLVQFEGFLATMTGGGTTLPISIAKGVEVKGAGATSFGTAPVNGAREVNGQLTIADERTFTMQSNMTGAGTFRAARETGLANPFKNSVSSFAAGAKYVDSSGYRQLSELSAMTASLSGDVMGGESQIGTLYHYTVAGSGLVATGQVQATYSDKGRIGCVWVEFTANGKWVKGQPVKVGYVSTSTHEEGVDFDTLSDVVLTNYCTKVAGAGIYVQDLEFTWTAKSRQLLSLSGGESLYTNFNGGRIEVSGCEGGNQLMFIMYENFLPKNGVLDIGDGGDVQITCDRGGKFLSSDRAYGDGLSSGSCKWVVHAGGTLWHRYGATATVGRKQQIELLGGRFLAAQPYDSALPATGTAGIHVNLVTFADGGLIDSHFPIFAGYVYDNSTPVALWKVRGSSPSSCAADLMVAGGAASEALQSLTWDVWDVTGDETVDFEMSGRLMRFKNEKNADRTNSSLIKRGAGTVRLSGVCAADEAYDREVDLRGGTWLFGASGVMPSAPVRINGGTLAAEAGTANDVGTLTVAATGTVRVAEGAVLQFADSSAAEWTIGAGECVAVDADLTKDVIRFGTDANGLTAEQLRVLRNAAGKRVTLDEHGWLRNINAGFVFVLR